MRSNLITALLYGLAVSNQLNDAESQKLQPFITDLAQTNSYTSLTVDTKSGSKTALTVGSFDVTFNLMHTEAHNTVRALHGVPDVALDEDLADQAQAYAQWMADNNAFEHSSSASRQNPSQGENLAAATSSSINTSDQATMMWYNEIDNPGYDFANPGFSSGTGHFTQVVWKATTHVGFGFATGSDGWNYVVGRYHPPGNMNMPGFFEENVPELLTDTVPGPTPVPTPEPAPVPDDGTCTHLDEGLGNPGDADGYHCH